MTHELIAAYSAQAAELRVQVPQLRAMAAGAAAVAKIVPDAIKRNGPQAIPEPMRAVAVPFIVDLADRVAGDAAEAVVTQMLARADRAEARAETLEEVVRNLLEATKEETVPEPEEAGLDGSTPSA